MNCTWEGTFKNLQAHGFGILRYHNGDKYVGECRHGKLHGFGTYYYNTGEIYIGYFAWNKYHGIGTFTDGNHTYKGKFLYDKKHGIFTRSDLIQTYKQIWHMDKLQSYKQVAYIPQDKLRIVIPYDGKERKCLVCCTHTTNATNDACGHVALCYNCLLQCDNCPICRIPIKTIIKLYIS
jgi:hypothetical protein